MNFLGFIELNDGHLLDLSRLITSQTELRILVIKGLKLSESTVQSALTDNPGDIHAAAYFVLRTWRYWQEDQVAAFNDLVTALKKCRMNQLESKLLESVGISDKGK